MKPAAIAIIFDDLHTNVLLVSRMDVPVWVLPGGGIDEGENPEQAAIREVKEETGLDIQITRLSGEYFPINRLAAYTYVYVGRLIGGMINTSSETRLVEFFPLDQLPKNLFVVHEEWLNDALLITLPVKKAITKVTYLAVLKHFLTHPMQVLKYLWTRLTKNM